MRKIIYSKYNQSRAAAYQTRTSIIKDNEEMYIEKTAVGDEAKNHIDGFKFAYSETASLYPALKLIDTTFVDDAVRYPFLNGEDMDSVIMSKATDCDSLLSEVKSAISTLFATNENNVCEYAKSEQYEKLFGDIDVSGMRCIKPCNLDLIFDNIMQMEDGSKVLFDYEWVFDITVPEKFAIYRVLCHFYERHFEYISLGYSFDKYMEYFGYNIAEVDIFRKMEERFIKHIYSNGEPAFSAEQYAIDRMKFDIANWKARDYDNLMKLYRDSEFIYKRMVRDRDRIIDSKEQELAQYKTAYEQVLGSKSWKLTKPIRWTRAGLASVKNNGVKQTGRIVKAKLGKKSVAAVSNVAPQAPSTVWYDRELAVSEDELTRQRSVKFENSVKFSVITPLFNTPEKYLRELIESVLSQTYSNLEFVMCDFSDEEHSEVGSICEEYAKKDSRIVYKNGLENKGISANTNTCIGYATGEYLALLDHDDVLVPTALYYMVEEINNSGADFIYSDEIKFEEEQRYAYAPNFKPDFSADELRVHNYICHLCVYKKSLLDKCGMYRPEFDGSQDHDIVLRLTECADKIVHVPRILYLWRVHQGSVALNINEKPYATIAGEKAVSEQFSRMGLNTKANSIINNIPCYRFTDDSADVSDIAAIVWGYRQSDAYGHIKEVLVKSGITADKIITVCEEAGDNSEVNYSGASIGELWNSAMKKHQDNYVLFVYAGIKDISEDAIKEMTVYTQRNDIASIDAKVVTDSRILSGGLQRVGDFENDYKFRCRGRERDYSGYENSMILSREVVASLGIFTMVNRNSWKHVGSFFPYNLKAMSLLTYDAYKFGGRNIWTPHIEVVIEDEAVIDIFEGLDVLYGNESAWKDPYMSDKIVKYGLE